HPDRQRLHAAVRAVEIEYEPLPGVFTIEESERKDPIIWGDDNTFKSYLIEKGDVDAVWAQAAHIVEGEYATGAQEQFYIENNGVIAEFSERDGVTVWGSMQCPFYVHKAMMEMFHLPEEKVRVVQVETGGAFGGKEDYPSVIGAHAALLARKAGRPIKMMYDRMEDMAATTKRHPSRTRHRTAVDKDGRLLGGEIEFVIDGGAYATLSPVVLSRGTIHAQGPYYWPAIRVAAKAMATNTPPHGAFRGFGAPQSIFALERHMDHIARVVGISPVEVRRRNFLKTGQTTATGQLIREPVYMEGLLDRALTESDYQEKQKQFERENDASTIKRGMGLACFFHGAGFTGSGERTLASVVGLEATEGGKVRVLASSTEFGQGTNTILSQIAAEALRLEYEDVEMQVPDTSKVPNSGPTVASRTAMIVGKLVHSAALGMVKTLQDGGLGENYTRAEFLASCARHVKQHGALKVFSQYEAPPNIFWDDVKYRGDAYPAYAWAAYVAEVSVDTTTYCTEVKNFVAVQEVGRVLHPILAKGQIEGGVAQGIGYAIYEKVVWREGAMANNQMTNYIMATSEDVPPMKVIFIEQPHEHGAYGAKGLGELPMDGPAPAILNAMETATGIEFNECPVLPEDVFAAMTEMAR
ncbi:MAG TPA: molybdopterin cofactor-binding domain-containing protein, partial [Acidobacteriaceae bacterium]|nr:molybdopterin cofactor-binding domain-containing protein [Acidobacteriaceae bacterium]